LSLCESEDKGTNSPPKVPKEVTYYHLCKTFHCLPHAGGLLEQDPAMLEAFLLIMQAENRYAAAKKERDAKAQKRNKKR
jgi:hypothetical protein